MSTPNDTIKLCKRCNRWLPATSEYFGGKNKIHYWCRSCLNEYKRERRRNPETRQHILDLDRNYNDSRTPEQKRAINNRRKIRYSTDEEYAQKAKDRTNRYRNNPANTIKISERIKKSYPLEKTKIRQRVSHHKRVALKHNLPSDFTVEQWERALEYFGYKCAVCGRSVDLWTVLATDHWIALNDKRSDNPGTVDTNIVPLCHASRGAPLGTPSCNLSKGDTDATKWLISRFGERKAKKILKRIENYFEWVRRQDDDG